MSGAALPITPWAGAPSGAPRGATANAGAPGAAAFQRARLDEAARQFEAFFMGQVLAQMRPQTLKSELLHGGRAEEMFSSLSDQALADRVTRRDQDTLGIGRLVRRQFAARAEQGAARPRELIHVLG